jgi:uncharacterized protein
MPFSPKQLTNSSLRPHGLSREHKIILGGLDLIPDLSGAIYVADYKTLVIADLHLEQGSSLARRGVHAPPFDTAVTLALLENVVASANPERLIFLGDSFHDGEGELRLQHDHQIRLRKITLNFETLWITGNHDPQPPQFLGGKGAETIALGPLTLRHEPTPQLAGEIEIAGHLHPGCGINQRGRRIYGKCFVSDETRLIMPAFGAYTGGLAITSKAFAGLFNKKTAHAHMIGRAALHKFPYARVSLS